MIAHKTIGSGDSEPKVYQVKVTPGVFDEIVSGRSIFDLRDRVVEDIQIGDILNVREWVLCVDLPYCYKYVGAFTRRELKFRVVSFLPARCSGFTTVVARLVNEKLLYVCLQKIFTRALGIFALLRRG